MSNPLLKPPILTAITTPCGTREFCSLTECNQQSSLHILDALFPLLPRKIIIMSAAAPSHQFSCGHFPNNLLAARELSIVERVDKQTLMPAPVTQSLNVSVYLQPAATNWPVRHNKLLNQHINGEMLLSVTLNGKSPIDFSNTRKYPNIKLTISLMVISFVPHCFWREGNFVHT